MYVYSLTQCLTDAHELEKSVEKLRNERRRLIRQIRLASVGLTKADGVIIVDTKVVKSTDEAVKSILGEELGLDIVLFLAMLNRNPDGKSI
jgi:histidinol-phosphate/aromatic aminotransferase/cobyric acid decarboxylase-like protein